MAGSPPQSLDVIQRWMQSVIVHPGGVVAGIEAASQDRNFGQTVDRVEEVICRSHAQTSIQRLEIYSNAYKVRLVEVLIGEYPALVHALGEEAFVGLAGGYLEVHPSSSYTLSELGRSFADYLAETRPPNESDDGSPDWADFLIDLARLERCYSEVFDGLGIEELPPLEPDCFQLLEPDQWIASRLVPAPCLRLVTFRFPVHEYASAVRHQQEPEIPIIQFTRLAIHRREYIVRRTVIDDVQFDLLTRLCSGATIGESLQQLMEANPQAVSVTAEDLRTWFRDWAAARFFVGLTT